MGAYVECPDGCRTFSTYIKAHEWLASLGYAPSETYLDGWPLCLARMFSDQGVVYWMKSASAMPKKTKIFS